MIHPMLATMLAVVTTDYPLEPGEAIEFLRARGRRELQRDLRRRRVLDERHRASARERRERHRAHAGDRRRVRRCLRSVCGRLAKQIVADGEGATVLAEIAVRGAASEPEARAIAERVATSPLVKTALYGHDANWGRIAAAAGSAKFNGGFARARPATASRSSSTTCRCSSTGRPTGVEPALANGRLRDRHRSRARRRRGDVPHDRSLLRLREDQRGVPHMTTASARRKVGGAGLRTGAARARRTPSRAALGGDRGLTSPLRRPRRRARRSPRRWQRRGLDVRSSAAGA